MAWHKRQPYKRKLEYFRDTIDNNVLLLTILPQFFMLFYVPYDYVE